MSDIDFPAILGGSKLPHIGQSTPPEDCRAPLQCAAKTSGRLCRSCAAAYRAQRLQAEREDMELSLSMLSHAAARWEECEINLANSRKTAKRLCILCLALVLILGASIAWVAPGLLP
jgi:hypothetical protein